MSTTDNSFASTKPSTSPPSLSPVNMENSGLPEWLQGHSVLLPHGLAIHKQLQMLYCTQCKVIINTSNIGHHLGLTVHKGQSNIPASAVLRAAEEMNCKDTIEPIDLSKIHNPIPGFDILEGLACAWCSHFTLRKQSLLNHVFKEHGFTTQQVKDKGIYEVPVQQLHSKHNFFRVHKPTDPVEDTISSTLLQLLDSNKPLDDSSESGENEAPFIAPFLTTTQWHLLVKSHDLDELYNLVRVPNEDEFPGLKSVVASYMERANDLIRKTNELPLKILNTESPTSEVSNTPLKALQESSTDHHYMMFVFRMVTFLLRSIQHPFARVSDSIRDSLIDLRSSLSNVSTHEQVLVLHTVFKQLWTPVWNKTDVDPCPDPTIRFLVADALTASGGFKDTKYLTQPLAILTRAIRLFVLCELHQTMAEQPGTDTRGQLDLMRKLAVHAQEKVVENTFDAIRSLQHLASFISNTTMQRPRVTYPEPGVYTKLCIDGYPCSLKDINSMLKVTEDEALTLMTEMAAGNDFQLPLPLNGIADDLAEDRIGFYFLHHPQNAVFAAEVRKKIEGLINEPQWASRYYRSSNGCLIPNGLAMNQFISHYARLQELLLLRICLGSGGPMRGRELVTLTLTNTLTRGPRAFSFFTTRAGFFRSYNKTTAIQGHDKVIVSCLDGLTSQLILHSLTIFRPLAAMFASIVYMNDPIVNRYYQDVVFVNRDRLFTTDDLTAALGKLSNQVLGWEMNFNQSRHVLIAFLRDLAPTLHNLFSGEEPDQVRVSSEQAGHTEEVENLHYAITRERRGKLPPAQQVDLFQQASILWHILLRVVPGGIWLPIKDVFSTAFDTLIAKGIIKLPVTPEQTLTLEVQSLKSSLKSLDGKVIELTDLTSKILATIEKGQTRPLEPEDCSTPIKKRPVKRRNTGKSPIDFVSDSEDAVDDHGTTCVESPSSFPLFSEITRDLSPEWPSSPIFTPMSSSVGTSTQPRSSLPQTLDPYAPIGRHVELLTAFQQLHKNENMMWRDDLQAESMTSILDLNRDVVLIFRTGYGKSSAFLMAAALEKYPSIVLFPLKALQSDFERKLTQAAIPFTVLDSNTVRISPSTKLILCSYDCAQMANFPIVVRDLWEQSVIPRIFIDEAMLPLVQTFRDALRNMYRRRVIPVQLVVLTATCPPPAIDWLLKAYGLQDPVIYRTSTDVPCHKYYVHDPADISAVKANLKQSLSRYYTKISSRVICALIFVRTMAQGRELSTHLDAPFYSAESHQDGNEARGRQILTKWMSGEHPTLIATSVLEAGIDNTKVRFVAYVGGPSNVLSLRQMFGRGGRDDGANGPTFCLLYPDSRSIQVPMVAPTVAEPDLVGEYALHTYLQSYKKAPFPQACIRFFLTSFTDGEDKAVCCLDDDLLAQCSVCDNRLQKAKGKLLHNRPVYSPSKEVSHKVPHIVEDNPLALKTRLETTFAIGVQQAQAREQLQLAQAHDALTTVKKALNDLSSHCMPCLIQRTTAVQHIDIRECPAARMKAVLDLKKMIIDHRKMVNPRPSFLCWKCMLPGMNTRLHPTTQCHWNDLASRTLYGIWLSTSLMKDLSQHFGITYGDDLDKFAKWLASPPKPMYAEMEFNLLVVLVWFANNHLSELVMIAE